MGIRRKAQRRALKQALSSTLAIFVHAWIQKLGSEAT